MRSSVSRAFLFSLAIHAALLLALIGIRYEAPSNGTPDVVRVTWVQLADGDSDGAAEPSPEEPAPVESTRSGETTTRPEDTVRDGPPEPRSVRRADEASPSRAASTDTDRATAAAAPPDEDPATANLAHDASSEAPPSTSEAAVIESKDAATPNEAAAASNPAVATAAETAAIADEAATAAEIPRPIVETVSVPHSERGMLQERIEEWTRAEDIEELTSAESSLTWEHDGQKYVATFTRLPAENGMDIDRAIVAISTEKDGTRLSTEMRMKRLAFSHYGQFVDRWDPAVQIHDDEIDGRFHSNSEIYIEHSRGIQPVFHGRVTTARGVNTSSSSRHVRRSEVFLGGLDTKAGRIALPRHPLTLPAVDPDESDAVHRFEEDARITFYAEGTYGWRYVDAAEEERRRKLNDGRTYLVGAEKAALHVKGVVNGKVLLYSPDDIVIEDDLIYASHPARDRNADDYLGLVSDRNVEIAEPETTGPGDLQVHASIYAKRRFVVTRYRNNEQATLSIFGSVTAGSVTATEPRYRTKVRFDRRLEELRPPGFPMTDRYELAAWAGVWRKEGLQ